MDAQKLHQPAGVPLLMPKLAEIWRAIYAAYCFLRIDPRAALLFENSEREARRSFVAYLIIIPALVLVLWQPASEVPLENISPLAVLIVEIERYIVTQLAFFLLADRITQRLGNRAFLMRYIAASNWAALPLIIIASVLGQFIHLSHLTDTTANLLQGLVYAVNVMAGWALTRGALQMKPLPAFGLCLIEVLFSIMVLVLFAMLMSLNIKT